MALSQDEQRVLAEIERRLTADDPGLATCLTAFRRPGPARVLRSPRARIIGSLFTVLLVAMVSLMVYAMIPFRAHSARTGVTQTAVGASGNVTNTAGTSIGPRDSSSVPPRTRSSAGTSASAVTGAQARSATPAAGPGAGSGPARAAGHQAAGSLASPAVGP